MLGESGEVDDIAKNVKIAMQKIALAEMAEVAKVLPKLPVMPEQIFRYSKLLLN